MDPQKIAAVAAFLAAAAGLVNLVVTNKRGWPRIVAVGAIAVVGILLLLIPGSNAGVDSGAQEYERRLREICLDKAQSEAEVKQQTDELADRVTEGSLDIVSLVNDTLQIQLDGLANSEALKAQLKALDPPLDREAIHHEAVATWERLIDEERSFVDEFRKRVAVDASQALAFAADYDPSEVRRLDDRVNDSLVELARSGCHPTP